MTAFLTNLQTEQDGKLNILLGVLRFEDEVHGTIEVPPGFVTNFASLQVFHNILLFAVYALMVTYGNRACTVHDYLYSQGLLTRKECDDLFYRALRADGVARWRAALFWAGVRIGGANHYWPHD